MVAFTHTTHQGVPEEGTGTGAAHGEAGGVRDSSRRRVPGRVYQTVAYLHLEQDNGTHTSEPAPALESDYAEDGCCADASVEQPSWSSRISREALANRQLLPRYSLTYRLLQYTSQTVLPKGVPAARRIQRRHDKDYRKSSIFSQTFKTIRQ